MGLTTCCGTHVLRLAKDAGRGSSGNPRHLLCHWEPGAIGCADARRSFEVRGTIIKTSQGETDEIQQAPHGPGRSMSSAPAGGEPGIGSRRRSPATLVTRCRHPLLPGVTV